MVMMIGSGKELHGRRSLPGVGGERAGWGCIGIIPEIDYDTF